MGRSRVNWLQKGEKPLKYFCSLEHQKFIDKTIKRFVSRMVKQLQNKLVFYTTWKSSMLIYFKVKTIKYQI